MATRPFIINEKRFPFDLTNAFDLARLQRAVSVLEAEESAFTDSVSDASDGMQGSDFNGFCKRYPAYLTADADMTDAAWEMLLLCRRYYVFFETLFPGKGEVILGRNPSVRLAREVFAKWITYLRTAMEEEERADQMLVKLYEMTGVLSLGSAQASSAVTASPSDGFASDDLSDSAEAIAAENPGVCV